MTSCLSALKAMTSAVGRTLRQIRLARGKSLAVVAGLAGISPSYLSRLESGDRAFDRRSLIVSLANALEVAPSEITGTSIVNPGELEEDRSLNEVRLALLSVTRANRAAKCFLSKHSRRA